MIACVFLHCKRISPKAKGKKKKSKAPPQCTGTMHPHPFHPTRTPLNVWTTEREGCDGVG